MDETSKQLIGEVQRPVSAAPGQVARYDYEYVRNGAANLFMIIGPLAGRRNVEVTERRTIGLCTVNARLPSGVNASFQCRNGLGAYFGPAKINKKDWAECLRQISEELCREAETIVVVQENLNTHTGASLCEA